MKADIEQFEFIDPKLRMILIWLEETTGVEFTATSLYRMKDEGVHGQLPLRGTDLRQRLESAGIAHQDHINANWSYDPNRPKYSVAKLHGEGSNMHLHLQVHPNTKRIVS
jgi:hypothetical protein